MAETQLRQMRDAQQRDGEIIRELQNENGVLQDTLVEIGLQFEQLEQALLNQQANDLEHEVFEDQGYESDGENEE